MSNFRKKITITYKKYRLEPIWYLVGGMQKNLENAKKSLMMRNNWISVHTSNTEMWATARTVQYAATERWKVVKKKVFLQYLQKKPKLHPAECFEKCHIFQKYKYNLLNWNVKDNNISVTISYKCYLQIQGGSNMTGTNCDFFIHTISPGHIWTTLYHILFMGTTIKLLEQQLKFYGKMDKTNIIAH